MANAERWGRLTGIKFLAIGLEGSPVMDVHSVSFLCFPLAFDGERDIDLQIVRSQSAHRRRGEQREGHEDALHLEWGNAQSNGTKLGGFGGFAGWPGVG